MPFWTNAVATKRDPKRVSRFKVLITALNDTEGGGTVWYAKSFSKPTAEVKTTTHRYLNHSFNYPGSVTWGDVTVELIDPADPIDAAGSLAQLLEAMGYQIPYKDSSASGSPELVNISKRKAVDSLGTIQVVEIDDLGNDIETWTLQQAFVTKFEWGSLKYDGDDLNVLKLTFKYDWAECTIAGTKELDAIGDSKAVTTGKTFFTNSAS